MSVNDQLSAATLSDEEMLHRLGAEGPARHRDVDPGLAVRRLGSADRNHVRDPVSARNWFTGPRAEGTAEELAAIERELEV